MIPSFQNLDLTQKRTFIRCDFNVPLNGDGEINDDSRILAALPTIQEALRQDAKVILASHLGRPKGQFNPKLSLLPVAEYLSKVLNREVLFPEDCISNSLKKLVADLRENQLILLENLRFHAGETKNDPDFCRRLAQNADVYINDAFGTLHRAHASTVGMVPLVAERAAGGLVEKEINALNQVLEKPERPFVAILGGAKVSDKIGVIENLLKKVDAILIGGAMAYTFLRAQGCRVGQSLVEESKIRQASKILERAKNKEIPLLLPKDHIVADSLDAKAKHRITLGREITGEWMGVDIGPQTREQFSKQLQSAKTVLWNGPLGAFEIPPFDEGTLRIAQILANSSAKTLVGGGDSVAAVKVSGLEKSFFHLSTGGGATLEYIEGKTLPGLKALEV